MSDLQPIEKTTNELTEVFKYPTTKEEILKWFHDNDWLLSNHSENIVRNARMYAYVWLHPNGVWAHGASHDDFIALLTCLKEGKHRLDRLANLLGDKQSRL